MGRLTQFLGGKLAQMLPQLCLVPAVEDFCDLLAANAKPVSYVVERSLARLFSVIVDLHRDGTLLAVA